MQFILKFLHLFLEAVLEQFRVNVEDLQVKPGKGALLWPTALFSLEEAENGSSPSLLRGTLRHKYLCLQGAACVVFLLHADPGQSSEASEVSTGLKKSYLGWVSLNSRRNNFFALFTSSTIPTQSLVTEYQAQPQNHVRRARVLGLAALLKSTLFLV